MPGGSGLEVAAALRRQPDPPKVIFTTAYPDHAVDAFDLAAADYLLKPFDADRLRRALERALRPDDGTPAGATPASAGSAPPSDGASPGAVAPAAGAGSAGTADSAPRGDVEPLVRIPVQKDGRTVLVDGGSIVYASAARGYSYLKLAEERLLVTMSLNELERRLRGEVAHRRAEQHAWRSQRRDNRPVKREERVNGDQDHDQPEQHVADDPVECHAVAHAVSSPPRKMTLT